MTANKQNQSKMKLLNSVKNKFEKLGNLLRFVNNTYKKMKGFYKKYRYLITMLILFVLGWFFIPKQQSSKTEIVNTPIHKDSVNSNIKQLEIGCNMMYCKNLSEEDCHKNSGYKNCVKKANQSSEAIRK